MTDDPAAQLRAELLAAVEGADYPVAGKLDLLPVLPDGPMTTFSAGDETFTVMELATEIGDEADFPYETPEALVEDIIAAMQQADKL
jgi:hypothetical protein